MAWNGSGTYSRPVTTVSPATDGTTIDSSAQNTYTADVTAAINACVAKNGENAGTTDYSRKTATETLTNKTLTTPVINSATGIGQSVIVYASADVTWASQETTLKTTGLTATNVAVGVYRVETFQSMIDGASTGSGDDGIKASLIFTNVSSMGGEMYVAFEENGGNTMREFSGAHTFSFDKNTFLAGLDTDCSIRTLGIVNVTNATNSIDLHMAQVGTVGTVGMKQTDAYMLLTRLT